LAKFASDETDFETFIDQRKIIVEFLEPQYQRIAAANDLWTSFVKERKTANGILGTRSETPLHNPTDQTVTAIIQATVLLERYAKTVERDLTPEVELIVRLHQKY